MKLISEELYYLMLFYQDLTLSTSSNSILKLVDYGLVHERKGYWVISLKGIAHVHKLLAMEVV